MSTNLPRITQKIFAQNAAEDDLLQFGSVLSGNATPSTSIAETQTTAYQTGWRSAVISDRNYPTLGEMNAVQQVPTQQLAYLFQKGIGEWDAGTTYYANVSYCQVNGVLYRSVSDNNIGNNPTTDNGTNWIIADLSNKITNCILSAPNGVATYSGSTITVKQGLKVLMPNGRNTDNTFKNLEFTLEEDVSREVDVGTPTNNRKLYLFIAKTEGSVSPITYIDDTNYYEQETQPFEPTSGRYGFWYNPYTAEFKTTTNGGAWTTAILSRIGYYTCFGGQITSLVLDQPVELLKRTDKAQITSWGFPSNKYVGLSLGASGQTYTAPADGWFAVSKLNGSSLVAYQIALVNQTANFAIEYRATSGTNINGRTYIPAKKGDVIQVNYDMTGATQYFRFVYAQGAIND